MEKDTTDRGRAVRFLGLAYLVLSISMTLLLMAGFRFNPWLSTISRFLTLIPGLAFMLATYCMARHIRVRHDSVLAGRLGALLLLSAFVGFWRLVGGTLVWWLRPGSPGVLAVRTAHALSFRPLCDVLTLLVLLYLLLVPREEKPLWGRLGANNALAVLTATLMAALATAVLWAVLPGQGPGAVQSPAGVMTKTLTRLYPWLALPGFVTAAVLAASRRGGDQGRAYATWPGSAACGL